MFFKDSPFRQPLALILTTSWAVAASELPPGTPLRDLPPLPELSGLAVNDTPLDAALLPPADLVPKGASRPRPSQNVTINLINRMVEKGLLTKEDATDLIQQAEGDAAEAKAHAEATQMVAKQSAAALALAQDLSLIHI